MSEQEIKQAVKTLIDEHGYQVVFDAAAEWMVESLKRDGWHVNAIADRVEEVQEGLGHVLRQLLVGVRGPVRPNAGERQG